MGDFSMGKKDASCLWQMLFLVKTLTLSVFKPRNIKTLLYRLTTVAMVVYYYYTVEKINYENRVENEYFLLTFVLVWHFISMNFKMFERNRLKKNEQYKMTIVGCGLVYGILIALFLIIWPILAAFDVHFTKMETDYKSSRYTYMFFYIALNLLISALPLFNNFMFFISDGILLS